MINDTKKTPTGIGVFFARYFSVLFLSKNEIQIIKNASVSHCKCRYYLHK